MKSVREIAEMGGAARQAYLNKHQAKISRAWASSAREENLELALRDPAAALSQAKIILEAAKVRDDPVVLALAYWGLGNAYLFCDRPRDAIASFERATRFYREPDHPLDAARVEISRVAAEIDRGYPDKALEIARTIWPILETSSEPEDRRRLGILAGNEGIALELQGDYEAALAAYERSQAITREVGPDDEEIQIARTEQNRALALTKLNRFEEAEAAYHEALRVLKKEKIVSDVVRVYTGLGWMYDAAGRVGEAKEAFDQAREWLARLSDEETLQQADLVLHELGWRLRHDPASVIAEAVDLREAYEGRAFLYAQEAALLEARARLETGDTAGARRVCAEVEEAIDGRALAGLLWQVHHLTGRSWEQEGDTTEARARYERAMDVIERDQRRIADVELRASALADKLVVYQDLAALLAEERDYEATLQIVERGRARALVDALANRARDIPVHQADDPEVQRLLQELEELRAELERGYRRQQGGPERPDEVRSAAPDADLDVADLERDYLAKVRRLSDLDPGYGTVLGTYVASTEEIRQALPPDGLLVEYYVAHGKLFAILLWPDGTLKHHPLGDVADVERWVKKLPHFESLPRRSLEAPDEQVWAELYERLVAGWHSALEGVNHLVIVPDGVLHYIPFQALLYPSADRDRYLIEDVEISYAPSSTLLVLATQGDPDRRDTALALGYAGGQLPHVQAELSAVAGAFSSVTLFGGDRAGREPLETFAPEADVIHVAAHGDFRPDAPLFSFIALADGRWQVTDAYRQRLSASLVTLGACWTGRGRLTGGDLVSFAHALFYAGARAVLVSLWPVHDASTAALMAAFYRGIRQGQRKAAALRQAQLALLGSDAWGDPLYWAPFCLMGADGLVGAVGVLRALHRMVERGQLSDKKRQELLDQVAGSLEAYKASGDFRHIERLVARIEGLSELKEVSAALPEQPLDRIVEQLGRTAEELTAWRALSAAAMDNMIDQDRPPLPPPMPPRPPIYNEAAGEALRLFYLLESRMRDDQASDERGVHLEGD